jgi:hypothetical protein
VLSALMVIGVVLFLGAVLLIVAWAFRESWLGDVIREVSLQVLEGGLHMVFEAFGRL